MRTLDPSRAADKVIPLDQLSQRVAEMKTAGKRVVLCHGVFDLLHYGHLLHFEEARRKATLWSSL